MNARTPTIFTHMQQNFIERVRPGQYHTDTVIKAIQDAAEVGARLNTAREHFASDRNLTHEGQRAKLVDLARKQYTHEYAKATRAVRKGPAYLKAQRDGLGVPKVDPNDLVGALNRQEIRAVFRNMPADVRHTKALALGEHPEIAAALLEAPPIVSGLEGAHPAMPTVQTVEQLREDVLQHLHGPKLASIDAALTDYQAAQGMAAAVREEIFKASGMVRDAFEEMMAPIEAEADA